MLLTLDKFEALVEILDELVIDNYQQELRLIRPCREIRDYCISHPELAQKVTIVLRKPHEILTSRGGTAPNKAQAGAYGKDRCVLPFKPQSNQISKTHAFCSCSAVAHVL